MLIFLKPLFWILLFSTTELKLHQQFIEGITRERECIQAKAAAGIYKLLSGLSLQWKEHGQLEFRTKFLYQGPAVKTGLTLELCAKTTGQCL